MISVCIPTSDGLVVGLLGFTHEDLDDMKGGEPVAPIDLRANFEVGMAVPSVIQLFVKPTTEELWETIYELAPGSRGKFESFDSEEER